MVSHGGFLFEVNQGGKVFKLQYFADFGHLKDGKVTSEVAFDEENGMVAFKTLFEKRLQSAKRRPLLPY